MVSLNETGSDYTRGACEVLKMSSSSSSSSSNGDEIKVVVNINSNSSSSSSNNSSSSDDVTSTNRTIATIGYSINNNKDDYHHPLERTMEIAHVHITDPSLYETAEVKMNIPRAAVAGLWRAMTGRKFDNNNNDDDTVTTPEDDDDDSIKEERSKWLGQNHDFEYWKYVYLTEPDSLSLIHI